MDGGVRFSTEGPKTVESFARARRRGGLGAHRRRQPVGMGDGDRCDLRGGSPSDPADVGRLPGRASARVERSIRCAARAGRRSPTVFSSVCLHRIGCADPLWPTRRTSSRLPGSPVFEALAPTTCSAWPRSRCRAGSPPGRSSSARATRATRATSSAAATPARSARTPTAGRSRWPTSGPATSSASWRCSTTSAARRRSRRSTTSQAIAIVGSDMRRLLREHADIAVKLVIALGRRLREANERLTSQSFQTVQSRVAGVLAGSSDRRRPRARATGDVFCRSPRRRSPSSPAPRGSRPAASSRTSSGPRSSPRAAAA